MYTISFVVDNDQLCVLAPRLKELIDLEYEMAIFSWGCNVGEFNVEVVNQSDCQLSSASQRLARCGPVFWLKAFLLHICFTDCASRVET